MVDLNKLSLSELLMLKQLVDTEKKRMIEMAKERNIFGKVIDIATTFGIRFPKNYGSYWVYIIPEDLMKKVRDMGDVLRLVNDADMVVIFDDYGRNAEVYYKGKKVFYVHLTEIEKVCAGEWMDVIDKLCRKAVQEREERERRTLIEEIKKEVEEWGIDLSQLIKRVVSK